MNEAEASAIQTIEGAGAYFDGLINRRRDARVTLGATLDIREGEAMVGVWRLETIRRVDAPESELRLRSTVGPELARLIIVDAPLRAAIIERCPAIHSDDAGWRMNLRIVYLSLAAGASIIALTWFGVPYLADRITPLMPRAFEARMGEMVDNQFKAVFDARICKGSEGQKAFAKLMSALQGEIGPGWDASGDVIVSKVKNAVALPGGRVYLFNGLLDAAETPDEIAGVIAHELGHVKHRDAMRGLVKAGGSSFLIGLLFGDVTGAGAAVFAARQLLALSYTREAEYDADGVAIDAMRALGRPIKPMGALLVRVTGSQDGAPEFLASHPLTIARAARFNSEDRGESGPPILDFGEWRALKNICADKD